MATERETHVLQGRPPAISALTLRPARLGEELTPALFHGGGRLQAFVVVWGDHAVQTESTQNFKLTEKILVVQAPLHSDLQTYADLFYISLSTEVLQDGDFQAENITIERSNTTLLQNFTWAKESSCMRIDCIDELGFWCNVPICLINQLKSK